MPGYVVEELKSPKHKTRLFAVRNTDRVERFYVENYGGKTTCNFCETEARRASSSCPHARAVKRHLSMEENTTQMPHWERGYRCHGYWLGVERIGFVSLSPEGFKPLHVSWLVNLPNGKKDEGSCTNVRKGKQLVEKAYREYLANENKRT